MAAVAGTKEVMLHGNASAAARARDRERLKQRIIQYLRQADAEGGLAKAEIARRLEVSERMGQRLLTELADAGMVEAVGERPGSIRITGRGNKRLKGRNKKGPTRTMVLLGQQLEGRETALVSRLLTARTWVSLKDLKGYGKTAHALKPRGITQLDSQGRVALSREAYAELTARRT